MEKRSVRERFFLWIKSLFYIVYAIKKVPIEINQSGLL